MKQDIYRVSPKKCSFTIRKISTQTNTFLGHLVAMIAPIFLFQSSLSNSMSLKILNLTYLLSQMPQMQTDRESKHTELFSVLDWLLLLTQRWKYDFMRSVTEQHSVWVGTLDPNPYLVSNESTVIAFIVFINQKSWNPEIPFYISASTLILDPNKQLWS